MSNYNPVFRRTHHASDEALVELRGRADSGERLQRAGLLLGITTPWVLAFFFTTTGGLETTHIYLWMRTRTSSWRWWLAMGASHSCLLACP